MRQTAAELRQILLHGVVPDHWLRFFNQVRSLLSELYILLPGEEIEAWFQGFQFRMEETAGANQQEEPPTGPQQRQFSGYTDRLPL
jgi:hypothetical protein